MVAIYGQLIIGGKKQLSDVPEKIREEVKEYLIDKGYQELVG